MDYLKIIEEISIKNKYTKTYLNLIKLAKLQNISGYTESHHIVPKCFNLGGQSDKNNIVILTAKQHYICHLLLTKMFSGIFKSKMIFAFCGFIGISNKKQQKRYSSRLYSYLKQKIREEYPYIKLYNKNKIKTIHKDSTELIENLLSDGWSKSMSKEFRDKISKAIKGRKHTDEAKNNMKIAQKNRPPRKKLTEQHKNNISKSGKGRVVKDSTKKLMSDIVKQQYKSGKKSAVGENNTNYGKRKIINIETKETKIVFIDEVEVYLQNGWKYTNKSRNK